MILFVSGRCDIPAFFSQWFFHRLHAGFVDVRNPFNPHQISRILLKESTIDVIIFCTKNPIPMLPRLHEIPFPYIFHITLTPYHNDMEKNVANKKEIIKAIKCMSEQIGKDRVIVRYDPILLNETYTIHYHVRAFDRMCQQLQDYIHTIIISFVDMYQNTKRNMDRMKLKEIKEQDMHEIGQQFGRIAKKYHIKVQTCAEQIDLSAYGIKQGECMNLEDISKAIGHTFEPPKGKGVRDQLCGCLASVDIGDYNCCPHECLYCYANYDAQKIQKRILLHDEFSSVLLGHIEETDHITIREDKKIKQEKLVL